MLVEDPTWFGRRSSGVVRVGERHSPVIALFAPIMAKEPPQHDASGSEDPVADRATDVDPAATASEAGDSWLSLLTPLLMLLSVLLLVAVVAWKVASDPIQYARARALWPATSGAVVRTALVDRAPGPRMPRKVRWLVDARWPQVEASYQVDGTTYATDRIAGYATAWRWRPTPQQILAALPSGRPVVVRFDPQAPGEAIIDMGVQGWQVYELLPALLVIGALSIWAVSFVSGRQARRDPMSWLRREDAWGRSRLRLSSPTGGRWSLAGLALGALVAAVATPAAFGRQPDLAQAVSMLLLLPAGAVGGALASRVWGGGRGDVLLVDPNERRVFLPQRLLPEQWKSDEGIPFRSLRAVHARNGSSDSPPFIVIEFNPAATGRASPDRAERGGDFCEVPLPRVGSTSDLASEAACWLTEAIGLRQSGPRPSYRPSLSRPAFPREGQPGGDPGRNS